MELNPQPQHKEQCLSHLSHRNFVIHKTKGKYIPPLAPVIPNTAGMAQTLPCCFFLPTTTIDDATQPPQASKTMKCLPCNEDTDDTHWHSDTPHLSSLTTHKHHQNDARAPHHQPPACTPGRQQARMTVTRSCPAQVSRHKDPPSLLFDTHQCGRMDVQYRKQDTGRLLDGTKKKKKQKGDLREQRERQKEYLVLEPTLKV